MGQTEKSWGGGGGDQRCYLQGGGLAPENRAGRERHLQSRRRPPVCKTQTGTCQKHRPLLTMADGAVMEEIMHCTAGKLRNSSK